MKVLPTLFKKTSGGALQYWTISSFDSTIQTAYGQVGGKEQVTTDTIREGKNIGRSNETTPAQQAQAEALAKWEKQIKKGYVEDRTRAEAGENDFVGGVSPMLAHKYSEQAKKIQFPAYSQPKLDGCRCIAIIKNGKASLWSRTRKPITSVPHIVKALEELFPEKDNYETKLDGELYEHSYHDNFDDLLDLIRETTPQPGHEVVQYHIYDMPTVSGFAYRLLWLKQWIPETHPTLKLVQTVQVNSDVELSLFHDECVETGYEGCMVRNMHSLYVNKRSYDLQKVKRFVDDEFKIVGIEEGRGRLQGHVGAFWCVTKDGKRFKAKMRGKTSKLREYFDNRKLWQDKQLTVQYQNLTPDGIPRFPVGKAIRDYE